MNRHSYPQNPLASAMGRFRTKFLHIIVVLAACWPCAGCFSGFGSDPIPPSDGSTDGDGEEIDGEDRCPNGVLDEGEECDDGNRTDGDGCDNDCTWSCRGNSDCDDGRACTDDTCNVENHRCLSRTGSAGEVCRPSAGVCDIEESCDGVNPDCPADELERAGIECRTAAGDCDELERCSGSDVECPADACKPEGTACSDADRCTHPDTCDAEGRCTGPSADELYDVEAIDAGNVHTCALTSYGAVVCWGANMVGQLGDGSTTRRLNAVDVAGLTSGAAAVSIFRDHTCGLMDAGGVRCWGWNIQGQLGDGTVVDRIIPVDVEGLASGVGAVSAGGSHTCALMEPGTVKCWGFNASGQLGTGDEVNASTPVDVDGLSGDASALSAGGHHTCALLAGGGIVCWGENSNGQVGDGSTQDRPNPVAVIGLPLGNRAVSAGLSHTCAILATGGVRCWGDNSSGQLGNGTTESSGSPVQVEGLATGVAAISAGFNHTCALLTGSEIKCWGSNDYGQLGDATTESSEVPVNVEGLIFAATSVSAGNDHTCAVVGGGRAMCWGYNVNGQIGDGTTQDRTTPVYVSCSATDG